MAMVSSCPIDALRPTNTTRRLTRKTIVVAISQLVVDKDGDRVVLLLQLLGHGARLGLGHLQTGPAIPLEAGRLGQPAQAGDETARRHGEGVLAIVGTLNCDGQAVGDEEQPARGGLVVDDTRHGDCVRIDKLCGPGKAEREVCNAGECEDGRSIGARRSDELRSVATSVT